MKRLILVGLLVLAFGSIASAQTVNVVTGTTLAVHSTGCPGSACVINLTLLPGMNYIGTWAANTPYAAQDVVIYSYVPYVSIASQIPRATFVPSQWAGFPGPQNPTGVNTFIYTGALAGIPANCAVSQMSFITDATAGQNLYFCTAANTWTQQSGGGSSGVASVSGTADQITSTGGATPVIALAAPLVTKLLDIVDVKADYGAVGNGVTDDTAAFTAAMAASKIVNVPCGTYQVTGAEFVSGTTLIGGSQQEDLSAVNSCSILRSSTGDILIAGATTVLNSAIENITFQSTTGGGHAMNFNAATVSLNNIKLTNVNCNQQNAGKACLYYVQASGGATFTNSLQHFGFDAEQASRTVPVIEFKATTVNGIDIEHGTITTSNTANGTYQIWLESTNASGPAYQNRVIDITSEVAGGGGINCLGCYNALIESFKEYDLTVLPANPIINIGTSGAGSVSRFNTIQDSNSIFGSGTFPDVNLLDAGSTETIIDSQFLFTNTANFFLNIGSSLGTVNNAYAEVRLSATGLINALSFSSGGAAATGHLKIVGSTSGTVDQTSQDAAGTPTVTWGTSSGTPAVTASAPLSITTATGNETCTTCVTLTGTQTLTNKTLTNPTITGCTGCSNSSLVVCTTSCTITANVADVVCTNACTVTMPVPVVAPGVQQICIYNDDNVSSAITLAALGSSSHYENTARTAYGTSGTGTLKSGGAVGDKVCVVNRDATHFTTLSFLGTWTAS